MNILFLQKYVVFHQKINYFFNFIRKTLTIKFQKDVYKIQNLLHRFFVNFLNSNSIFCWRDWLYFHESDFKLYNYSSEIMSIPRCQSPMVFVRGRWWACWFEWRELMSLMLSPSRIQERAFSWKLAIFQFFIKDQCISIDLRRQLFYNFHERPERVKVLNYFFSQKSVYEAFRLFI